MFETAEEALEALGQQARDAFEGKTDEPWEYRPECVDGNEATWYEWCDDCKTFHKSWYLFGYEVTEGNVEMIVWCCDQDGNWDISEGADVGKPEAKMLMEHYSSERWEQSYANYLRYVAETGEDPCEEFILPPDILTNEKWEVHVIERGERVWVTKAGMLGGESYMRPGELPEYVYEFLLLSPTLTGDKVGAGRVPVASCAIDPEHVKSLADLGDGVKWQSSPDGDAWVTTVTIPHYTPALLEEEVAAVLREKANKARAQLVFARP